MTEVVRGPPPSSVWQREERCLGWKLLAAWTEVAPIKNQTAHHKQDRQEKRSRITKKASRKGSQKSKKNDQKGPEKGLGLGFLTGDQKLERILGALKIL